MRWGCLFFFLLVLSAGAGAQVNIKGTVMSDVSGEPLSGASVYINNSTMGSTTAADGSFHLTGVRPGIYDIIVSYVSYDVIIHTVTVADKDLRFQFRLQPKPQQMRNILVMSDERRRRTMDLFRKQFLGITMAGEKCRIENEKDISFGAGEGKRDIYAYADHPLIIINRELGYRISFDLQDFYVDESTGRTYFAGFTFYEDLDKGNKSRFVKKRKLYYYGSTMHFYHSMYAGNSRAEQFAILRRSRISSNGKVTTVQEEVDPSAIVRTDTASGRKYMSWDNDIIVQYLKDPYYKNELFRKTMVMGSLKKGVESQLTMLEKPVYFTDLGMPEFPLRIAFSGFWSYEKFGNMLPIDYRPDQ